MSADQDKENYKLQARSGFVHSTDPVVGFIYLLLRDHLPAGVVEGIVRDCHITPGISTMFTNGYLAKYAMDIAERLKENATL